LWSQRAVHEQSFVRKEAGYALDHGKLVPARIARCNLPLRFRDAQTADLTRWNRRDVAYSEWRRTLGWIAPLVGRPPTAPTPTPDVATRSTKVVVSNELKPRPETARGQVSRRALIGSGLGSAVVIGLGVLVARAKHGVATGAQTSSVEPSSTRSVLADAPITGRVNSTEQANPTLSGDGAPSAQSTGRLAMTALATVPCAEFYNSDSLAVSPNGNWIALAPSAKAEVWETSALKRRFVVPGGTGRDHTLQFSQQSDRLAIGSFRTVRLVELKSGALRWSTRSENNWWDIWSMDFAPDTDEMIVSGSESGVAFLDSRTGKIIDVCKGHTEYVGQARYTPDGEFAVTGPDKTGQILVWRAKQKTPTGRIATTEGRWLDLSTRGDRIISTHDDATARVWSFPDLKPIGQFNIGESDHVAALVGRSRSILAIQGYSVMKLFDWNTGDLVGQTEVGVQNNNQPAAFPDDRVLAASPPRLWKISAV
jgi:hypothetical protein